MTRVARRIKTCPKCGAPHMSPVCPDCGHTAKRSPKAELIRDGGFDRSELMRRSENWRIAALPLLLWNLRFSVVFSAEAHSKNRSHVVLPTGKHKRVSTRVNQEARSEIADKARRLLQDNRIRVVRARLWVDMLVQKNNWAADAGNVVDTVFDGLKIGIGMDDNMFSIRALDWEIVKGEQRLIIGIGQDTDVDQDFCMTCGSMVPYLALRRIAGIDRVCDSCSPPE